MSTEDLEFEGEPRKRRPPFSPRRVWNLRWYLLTPLFIVGIGAFFVAEFWPVLYRSEALILVEGQKVPEQYVTPNVVSSLQTRLDSMMQKLLSRTRLQRLIEDFNLYPKERARMIMDDVIENMRKNISVEVVQAPGRGGAGDVTGFRIAYSAADPKGAQRVTNEITSLFIEESLRSRTQQSLSTTAFFESQLEEARKDLEQQEARLRLYKSRFMGELPEQQQANLQILSSLQAQLYAASGALARAEQQRVYLESLKSQYPRAADGTPVAMGAPKTISPARTAAETQLEQVRREYADAKTRYTDKNPIVVALKEQVEYWKGRISDMDKQAEAAEAAPKSVSKTAPVDTDLRLIDIESRLKSVITEIASNRKDEESIRERIKDIQSRINLTPAREQELADVTRTYENSRTNYQSLLQKKMQSELASNLEKRQQGEQFRILDPANLPGRAEGRMRVIGLGWALGFALGCGVIALRVVFDPVVHEKDDIALETDIPVIARLPVIPTQQETRRQMVWRIVEVAVVVVLIVASGAGVARGYLSS
jgi:polysaccharide biosynthesis transport protein